MSRWLPYGLLTALLHAASMPPWEFWWLAFVILVPLLIASEQRDRGERLLIGAVTGSLCGMLVAGPALATAVPEHFALAWLPALPLALTFCAVQGALPYGLLTVLLGDITTCSSARVILRTFLAVALVDQLRETLPGLLPWALLGHALAPLPALAKPAAVAGTPLVSALLAAVAACVYVALRRERKVALTALAVVAAGWSASALVSAVRIGSRPAAPVAPLVVELVQPALTHAERHDIKAMERLLDRARQLRVRSESPPALRIWPEGTLPVPLPANHAALQRLILASGPAAAHLIGAPRFLPGGAARFNAAVLAAPSGMVIAVHDKHQLVPLAEAAVFGWKPAPGAALTPGPVPQPMRLSTAAQTYSLGVMICYEALFPAPARRLVAGGASVLVNLSDDSYFGRSAGAAQHFAAARLRAIETGRPLLRVTQAGVSAAVDDRGQLLAALPAGQPGVLRVSVDPASGDTLASVSGRLLGPAALLLLATLGSRRTPDRQAA